MKLYQHIARTLLRKDPQDKLNEIARAYLPSGSGIDSGCDIDAERSKPNRIVINFGYHHMDEHGGYTVWTHHDLIIKPDLCFGLTLRITGPDRDMVKEYLYELFHQCLNEEIDAQ